MLELLDPALQKEEHIEELFIEPDWDREKLRKWWDPSRQLLKSIRSYQKWKKRDGFPSKIFTRIHVLEHRFWSAVTGADIPLTSQIGGGLKLTHPNGVVIHPNANIGINCLILQQVTIVNGVTIGHHVDIGAGAKILKQVTIGNHAKVGANAVVLSDVPDGAIAVGIPARIITSKKSLVNPEELHQNELNTLIESLSP